MSFFSRLPSPVLAALAGCLALAACKTVPYTGRSQAVVVPDAEMEALGEDAFAEIRAELPEVTAGPAYEQVQRVSRQIISQVPEASAAGEWEVVLFDSEEINAFALPGRKVGIYTGILPVLKNEAGLAAVVGHEIGHVIARHSGERVSRALITQLGLSVADISLQNAEVHDQVLSLLGVGTVVGVELPFSRANETEADELGGIFMAKAGYDPRESVAVWERMASQRGSAQPPEVLSTHPSDASRIASLESLMPTFQGHYRAAPVQRGLGETLATRSVSSSSRASSDPAPSKPSSTSTPTKGRGRR